MSTTTTTNTVTVALPAWLASDRGLVSRELVVEVLASSAKAVKVRGHANVRPSDHCLRCGHPIENPVSRLAGYGPYCSDELGIPRVFRPEEIDAVRALVEQRVVELWLPRRSITVLSGTLEDAAPAAANASVRIDGGLIVAVTPYAALDVVKSVGGGRWDKAARRWTWPVSEIVAAELVAKLRGCTKVDAVEVAPEVEALIEVDAQGRRQAAHKVDDAVPDIDLDLHGAPPWWLHQRRAFHAARGQSSYMLAIGMGGGKSRVAVDLVRDAGDQRVLVLCPKNVVGVWPKQFRLYAPGYAEVVAPRKGPKGGDLSVPKRVAIIEDALAHAEGPMVVVVNHASVLTDAMAKLLLGVAWDRVIVDESHRIKMPQGKVSRFCWKIGRSARRRLALTGTPLAHSPLDVFGQYRFLDPALFGTSFTSFRSRYAVMGGYGGHEVLAYQRQDELADKMYRIAYRIADEELDAVLGLEPPLHETRTCTLSAEARRCYEEFWSTMRVQIDAGEVTAKNALVKLLRLQQMTSGHVPVETVTDEERIERTVVAVDTAKRDELLELVRDIPEDQPVVVFARFTHDLDSVEWVAAKLGRTYGELSGRRDDALTEESTLTPGVALAGVQMQAGGVGVDFTASHYCVFYSVGFSLGDFDQALKRTQRPGQAHRVTYYHLMAEDTVDEKVYDALRARKNVVDYVLGLAS